MPKTLLAVGEAMRDRSTPEYAADWKKCRELGKQLSVALAETGDEEFALIQPAGNDFAVSFGQTQEDMRRPAEFPMQTITRLASRISLVLRDDPAVAAERVVITERGVHTIVKLPGFTDPLVEAINDYLSGCKAYREHPDVDEPGVDEDAVVAATYGKAMDRLCAWDQPAASLEGAIAALKFFGDANFCDGMANPMRLAVLRYLEAL
ncbi:MAG TPA: hypothetical protein VGN93_13205 [Shinella sp.]|uniref:hypothetical protein n=1 Tax=Shinella sp. TaxID=1870904 RepID=UPI002E0FFE50|nr:hypothetical protein [Shinella sp.]